MAFLGSCLSAISDCLYGTGSGEWRPHSSFSRPIPASQPIPEVILDTSTMGQEAVVVKNGSRLCGTGAVKASNPILQNKAYWEVKLQQSGIWSCGLCSPGCDLNNNLGLDPNSWALTSQGTVRSNDETQYKIEQTLQEGDILGFTYDHVELNFFLNGTNLNCPILGMKGTVFPVFYVDDGAILDAIFENFHYPIPAGYDRIMVEKSLL